MILERLDEKMQCTPHDVLPITQRSFQKSEKKTATLSGKENSCLVMQTPHIRRLWSSQCYLSLFSFFHSCVPSFFLTSPNRFDVDCVLGCEPLLLILSVCLSVMRTPLEERISMQKKLPPKYFFNRKKKKESHHSRLRAFDVIANKFNYTHQCIQPEQHQR